MNENDYAFLKKRIKQLIGIDLDYYKVNQMMRRLDGYIVRSGASGVVPYCNLLEQSLPEREKLRNFITINVSEFYRDVSYFNILKNEILPELVASGGSLKIWSAGCSDGQEPYTVAILLNELAENSKHRILATDIDKVSLEKAQQGGPYRPAEVRNLPRHLIARYFVLKEEGYYLDSNIRNMVVFRQHNLVQDSFEGNFDLIICRNVVIYFSNEAKQELMSKFISALKEKGILFIGATESILNTESLGIKRLSPCFYQKISSVSDTVKSSEVTLSFAR
jgi:chemotaxis protein methyltransferase CheR